MKLRNKKTGEIGELCFQPNKEYHFMVATEDPADTMIFKTLARLNEEWEDYEETEYYFIDGIGIIRERRIGECEEDEEARKIIGNYFETKEQAEKAVEKLKAWKRLKDKGLMFCGTDCINKNNVIYFEFGERPLTQSEADEAEKDLDLLFGGEE